MQLSFLRLVAAGRFFHKTAPAIALLSPGATRCRYPHVTRAETTRRRSTGGEGTAAPGLAGKERGPERAGHERRHYVTLCECISGA